jgi:hypothetical protein
MKKLLTDPRAKAPLVLTLAPVLLTAALSGFGWLITKNFPESDKHEVIVNGPAQIGNGNKQFVFNAPSRNYFADFPKEIQTLLDKNREKVIKIFSESGNKEAGDYSCSIHDGLRAKKFNVHVWADSKSGFGSVECVQGQSEYPLYLNEDLPDFLNVKNNAPILELGNIRVLDVNSARVIIWVNKR